MTTTTDRKILVAGLDESGKTSIILSLKGNRNLLSFYSLKPTQGLNVNTIEDGSKSFHVWELGGQRIYRVKYLEDFSRYTENVDKLIYVIDVQDLDRYEDAILYFESIVLKFQERKTYPELSIFLHKYDPGIENVENEDKVKIYSDKVLAEAILNKISTIVGKDFPLKIYKTTIFTVFRKTPMPLTAV